MHPEESVLASSLLPAPPFTPVPDTGAAPAGLEVVPAAEYRELRRLADRAELWASIAPGLGHHLANALMSLSVPGDHPAIRGGAHARVERAHRVLTGLCDDQAGAFPAPLETVLDEVETWHRLQLGLPRCEVVRELEAGLTVPDDSRLHHLLIAIVTLAKERSADRLEIRASRRGGGARIEIEERGASGTGPAALARREAVVADLAATLGGSCRVECSPAGRRWTLELPARVRR